MGATQQAAQALESYYSASHLQGLFAAHNTSADAQDTLLAAVDQLLTPQQRQQTEGTLADNSISLEDLTGALGSVPSGKAPGFDGLPYEFYQRFWDQLGPELAAVLHEAFQPGGPEALPAGMMEGRITLLYKGKGADRAVPTINWPTRPTIRYTVRTYGTASVRLPEHVSFSGSWSRVILQLRPLGIRFQAGEPGRGAPVSPLPDCHSFLTIIALRWCRAPCRFSGHHRFISTQQYRSIAPVVLTQPLGLAGCPP